MSIDPTAIRLIEDPRHQRFSGIAVHGDTPFDVPYISQIAPDLWMGGCRNGLKAPYEIKHVFSLYPWEKYELWPHQTYSKMGLYDSHDQDLGLVEDFAEMVFKRMDDGPCLVHCQAGLNRSALVVATILVRHMDMLPGVAIARLRELRSPAVLCNTAFEQFVRDLA